MTETGVGSSWRKAPFWTKALLFGSLMLNVVLISVAAGHHMKPRGKAESASNQAQWIIELVPEERRDYTKAQFREVRAQFRSLRQERRVILDDIIAAMRTEPFEPDALILALENRRQAGEQTKSLVHGRLVDLMIEFSPEERAVFADRLTERVARMRDRRAQ